MRYMLDFHLHLARLPHAEELKGALEKRDYRYISIACEPWEWEKVAKLGCEAVAFGIHPMIATELSSEAFETLENFLTTNESASVGECGLDKRYPGYEEGGIQEQVFLKQVALAVKYRRDLQIHCVGDYGRIVKLLKQENYPPKGDGESSPKPIFHRFGGDAGIIRAALPLDALFSIHADSFHKKSTAAAIAQIPEENIRFETDADETTFKTETVEEIAEKLTANLAAVQDAWRHTKA